MWTVEFEKDESLGVMEDCYNNLKAKSRSNPLLIFVMSFSSMLSLSTFIDYKFEQPDEPAPPTVDDDIRRKEEEELQRVLEMSMQDRGGRSQWSDYSLAAGSSSSAAGAGASGTGGGGVGRSGSVAAAPSSGTGSSHPFAQPKYQAGGYVPARTPSPATMAAQQHQQQLEYQQAQQKQAQQQLQTAQAQAQAQAAAAAAAAAAHAVPATVSESLPPTLASTSAAAASSSSTAASTSTATGSASSMAASGNIVTRVRALHTFEATEPGELAFDQGDIIKVVDRGYKDWWRGQLKGRTGIFPVNYVVRFRRFLPS